MRGVILLIIFTGIAFISNAQEYRSYNGTLNNLSPERQQWGAVGTALQYRSAPAYEDGISAPVLADRPNPRKVSNDLFAQKDFLADRGERSDFIWIFGQFLDHDMVLVPGSADQQDFLPILVEETDPHFNAGDLIPMQRSAVAPGSGTDPDNFRKTFNMVTSYIDGSAVYGSDKEHADWLRTFQNGKLKTSRGNLLPWNTITGELGDPIDPQAPHMEDQTFSRRFLFVAGDIRANENPLLLSMHTLFVREHNRLCDQILFDHPDWSDEQIYQKARKLVGALIQAIVYEEWLPAMGIILRPYRGYDPTVQPDIYNVFSAAAFRLGHTMINSSLLRVDAACNEISAGHLRLKDVFFNPEPVLMNGLEPILKGMCIQPAQRFDCRVVDDVRNFLFSGPGSPFKGMDLAAINIMRGRERGLGSYNAIREDFQMNRFNEFIEICRDPQEAAILESLYGSVDRLDAWVGMLAEDPAQNALFGQLIMTILKAQFSDLRDGDRFYYENDPGITELEKQQIKQTRLADLVRRNTELSAVQDDIFFASSCEEMDFEQIPVIGKDMEFTLFPNPVFDQFTVKWFAEDETPVILRLTDLTGRILMERELQVAEGYNRFDLEMDASYPTGIYQISFYKKDESVHYRIVKQ